jgi:hypothetical protein
MRKRRQADIVFEPVMVSTAMRDVDPSFTVSSSLGL